MNTIAERRIRRDNSLYYDVEIRKFRSNYPMLQISKEAEKILRRSCDNGEMVKILPKTKIIEVLNVRELTFGLALKAARSREFETPELKDLFSILKEIQGLELSRVLIAHPPVQVEDKNLILSVTMRHGQIIGLSTINVAMNRSLVSETNYLFVKKIP